MALNAQQVFEVVQKFCPWIINSKAKYSALSDSEKDALYAVAMELQSVAQRQPMSFQGDKNDECLRRLESASNVIVRLCAEITRLDEALKATKP